MREIYAAASGAGVAVAFGAPIGGVLFSLEEMMSFGGLVGAGVVGRGFLMALVACMVIRGINPFWTGGLVMFEVHYERDWHFFEVQTETACAADFGHRRSFFTLSSESLEDYTVPLS